MNIIVSLCFIIILISASLIFYITLHFFKMIEIPNVRGIGEEPLYLLIFIIMFSVIAHFTLGMLIRGKAYY